MKNWLFYRVAALLLCSALASKAYAHPLIAAAARGDLETVTQLLEEGADVNQMTEFDTTALIEAARFGHLEVVRVLLAVPGIQIMPVGGALAGPSALQEAVNRRHQEIADLLISHGAYTAAMMNELPGAEYPFAPIPNASDSQPVKFLAEYLYPHDHPIDLRRIDPQEGRQALQQAKRRQVIEHAQELVNTCKISPLEAAVITLQDLRNYILWCL